MAEDERGASSQMEVVRMPDMKPTREQHRAQVAFTKVSDIRGKSWAPDYGRQCMHLPALIHHCGLCQALTFLQAKGADETKKPWFSALLNDLAAATKIATNSQTLLQKVREADVKQYQRMTHEALACAQWFQRYAEAILKVELGADGGKE